MARIQINDLPTAETLTAEELELITGAGLRSFQPGIEALEARELPDAGLRAALLPQRNVAGAYLNADASRVLHGNPNLPVQAPGQQQFDALKGRLGASESADATRTRLDADAVKNEVVARFDREVSSKVNIWGINGIANVQCSVTGDTNIHINLIVNREVLGKKATATVTMDLTRDQLLGAKYVYKLTDVSTNIMQAKDLLIKNLKQDWVGSSRIAGSNSLLNSDRLARQVEDRVIQAIRAGDIRDWQRSSHSTRAIDGGEEVEVTLRRPPMGGESGWTTVSYRVDVKVEAIADSGDVRFGCSNLRSSDGRIPEVLSKDFSGIKFHSITGAYLETGLTSATVQALNRLLPAHLDYNAMSIVNVHSIDGGERIVGMFSLNSGKTYRFTLDVKYDGYHDGCHDFHVADAHTDWPGSEANFRGWVVGTKLQVKDNFQSTQEAPVQTGAVTAPAATPLDSYFTGQAKQAGDADAAGRDWLQ